MKIGNKKSQISYGIVGLGRFGTNLALQLAARGKDILVIDGDEDRVSFLREHTENAYVVRNLDKRSLEETGIQNCEVAIVCIGERLDTSILTTLSLKSLGVPQVIAKANSAEHGEILEKLGAEVVYPERDMAIRLSQRLEPVGIEDLVEISENINVSTMQVPKACIGKTILELEFRKRYGFNIVAIRRDSLIITDIKPEMKLQAQDYIYVLGDYEHINQFELDHML